ncbi:MAG: helix-turn-helix domain-containing protein [Acidobacteria bacterium]|jgi:ribosome-binding protein aMBF1 (putative translation factor)|nr:helix-turn-helix domain-containing protein [Acidobacteriota bacterium]
MKEKNALTTFETHLTERYGEIGTKKRDEFELKAKAFIVGEMIKETRQQAKMTQEQLAEKTGTKKSYISRLENGKIDIQISTLFKIFEEGFGRRLNFVVS